MAVCVLDGLDAVFLRGDFSVAVGESQPIPTSETVREHKFRVFIISSLSSVISLSAFIIKSITVESTIEICYN